MDADEGATHASDTSPLASPIRRQQLQAAPGGEAWKSADGAPPPRWPAARSRLLRLQVPGRLLPPPPLPSAVVHAECEADTSHAGRRPRLPSHYAHAAPLGEKTEEEEEGEEAAEAENRPSWRVRPVCS